MHYWTELSVPWAEGLGTWGSKMAVPASMRRIQFWISLALVSPEKVVSNLDSLVAKSFSPQLSPMHRIQTSPCAFIAQHGFMLWRGGGKGAVANLPFSNPYRPLSTCVWFRLGFRDFPQSIILKHDVSITVSFATLAYLIFLIIVSEVSRSWYCNLNNKYWRFLSKYFILYC